MTSETDTRYFDREFTGESVQLTPPDQVEYLNVIAEESENVVSVWNMCIIKKTFIVEVMLLSKNLQTCQCRNLDAAVVSACSGIAVFIDPSLSC